MKKHRVLLVVKHPVGGIRTFFRYFYRNLDRDKYHFTLIAPALEETSVLLDDLRELDLDYVSADRNASNLELFRLVTRVIREQSFGLIHSHGYTAAACASAGALSMRVPHIVTSHEVLTPGQFVGLRGVLKKVVLGTILSMMDTVHCVSNDARDNLLSYLPILKLQRRKLVAIRHGIEVGQFLNAEKRDLRGELGLPSNSFLIGFLGRFMSPKGFRYLVEALELLKGMDDLPKEPLVLAFSQFDGFIREEQRDVKKRGLAESVLFLPFVPDVASTLKGLDVVVMPSLWEACPLLAMETMVAGVPMIGTNCIGLREVLEHTPARIVPPRDGVDLAKALIREMTDPTTEKARAFALEAARRFEVRGYAADLERVMLKFLEK